MMGQLTSIVLSIAASCAACGCVNGGAGHTVARVRQASVVRTPGRTVFVVGRGKASGWGVRARLGAARAARIDAFRNAVARGVGGHALRRDGVRRVHGRVVGCKEVASVWDDVRSEYRVTLECPDALPRRSAKP